MMEKFKVFIASSLSNLSIERKELVKLMFEIDDELEGRGIYIDSYLCDYSDTAMRSENKEEEYLKELRTSDLCLVLFWQTAGQYSIVELDEAVKQKRTGGHPYSVYVLFKELAEDGTINNAHAQAQLEQVKSFKLHLNENYPDVPHAIFSTIGELRAIVHQIILSQV